MNLSARLPMCVDAGMCFAVSARSPLSTSGWACLTHMGYRLTRQRAPSHCTSRFLLSWGEHLKRNSTDSIDVTWNQRELRLGGIPQSQPRPSTSKGIVGGIHHACACATAVHQLWSFSSSSSRHRQSVQPLLLDLSRKCDLDM